MAQGSKLVVVAALAGNLAIAVIKFIAAAITGSAGMLSEGVHSLVDTVNEMLLLYGMKRAQRPPDDTHPFGYGRELYFWAFIVALLIFTAGAGAALYEGVSRLRAPASIDRPLVAFCVLALSAVFEGISWRTALTEFRRTQGERSFWQAFRQSKDPSTFIVLFEDSAALAGLAVAAAGIGLSLATGDARWDGAASIVIAVMLAVVALVLAREAKALLIGERADPALSLAICDLAAGIEGVERANAVATVQLAPDQVVVNLSVDFEDDLRTPAIEAAVEALEAAVRAAHPEVAAIFVKPQSSGEVARRRARGGTGVTAD